MSIPSAPIVSSKCYIGTQYHVNYLTTGPPRNVSSFFKLSSIRIYVKEIIVIVRGIVYFDPKVDLVDSCPHTNVTLVKEIRVIQFWRRDKDLMTLLSVGTRSTKVLR